MLVSARPVTPGRRSSRSAARMMSVTRDARDRDPAGRPRQARPRDEMGRPLPYGDPRGVEPVPEEPLPAAEALALAQSLLDTGRAFAAHEVLEAAWKAAPDDERDLWQGLAQICVGITHAQRGNRANEQAKECRGEHDEPKVGVQKDVFQGLPKRLVHASPTQ